MKNNTARITILCSLIIAVIMVLGTIWSGQSAKKDTEQAARTVSILYLDELAGRREQVVENNLQGNIQTIQIAIGLLSEEDLSDKAHLEAYQSRMKQLYKLDKFAFVDADGLIYTSLGTQDNIEEYGFDYRTISKLEISTALKKRWSLRFRSVSRLTGKRSRSASRKLIWALCCPVCRWMRGAEEPHSATFIQLTASPLPTWFWEAFRRRTIC